MVNTQLKTSTIAIELGSAKLIKELFSTHFFPLINSVVEIRVFENTLGFSVESVSEYFSRS